jgi:hypothetical protein
MDRGRHASVVHLSCGHPGCAAIHESIFMSLARLAALCLVLLSVSSLSASAQEDYPFTGEWNCDGAPFVFTSTVYSTGDDDFTIQEVQEGSDGSYTLFLTDEVYITLSDITDDTLSFSSSESNRTMSCHRY